MTGPEFRARRVALGLSYRRAAAALGVSLSTIYRWEAEQRRIPALAERALRDLAAERAHHDPAH
ncbi:MAG TPA: helix-turn-helix transcriptional regulator [Dehalococcoidia bacterium]|nr:helix-turn-helix transcriptional regulator [Dehalococcoidia bacterium]